MRISLRQVHADAGRPQWVEELTRKTFLAMIRGVLTPTLVAALISPAKFDAGLRDLDNTAAEDGVICCTFSKAMALTAA